MFKGDMVVESTEELRNYIWLLNVSKSSKKKDKGNLLAKVGSVKERLNGFGEIRKSWVPILDLP